MKKLFPYLNLRRTGKLFEDNGLTTELEATVVDRLTPENINELAEKNVTFFYDKETDASYRIEIVEREKKREVVVTVIPTGLGKVASHRDYLRA